MKYNLFTLLFLIFSFAVFSQNTEKSILIKDIDTNLPIEDAIVCILKTKQNLISNSEGKVSFVLKGNSNIQVTQSSYISVIVRSTTLLKNDNVIYLKSNISDLEEIIITKLPPHVILKSIVENSIKKLTVPARLKMYSREFFKINGGYANYNDGLINFQLTKKDKNFNNIILVEQNRSYGILSDEFNSDVLGYNLNNLIENYYSFKYLIPLIEPNALKEYDFVIKGYTANSDYNVIVVTPLDNTKKLLDNYKIIYDYKKKIILEVSSTLSPSTLAKVKEKTMVGSKNIYKSFFKNIYRFDNANYYLVSSKEEIGFERIEKDKKSEIEVRNFLVTTSFSTNNYTYNESDVFKYKTLYNKKNVILDIYWNTSGLSTTDEEQDIVDKLANRIN